MKLRILGCSGGIGGSLRTTSMLLDNDILIDAGTGVGDLTLAEMSMIDHVFVTHSHLDHIASIPLMVDSVGSMRGRPITVHATAETIALLQQHVFNWSIWPDFTRIPDEQHAFMRYHEITLGKTEVLGGRRITPLPAHHVVPAVGFLLDSGTASLAFTGDTSNCDALWQAINAVDNLRYLIVETAFSNAELALAELSRHYCPVLLAKDLQKLKRDPEIYITHLKPGEIELTMQEIAECVEGFVIRMLQNGQVFEF